MSGHGGGGQSGGSGGAGGAAHDEHGPQDTDKLIFPAVALIIGLMLDEANKRTKFLGMPDSVLHFLSAMITSLLLNRFLPDTVMETMEHRFTWNSLQPETILLVMLPPLLFESAFKTNSHMFFAKLKLIAALTGFLYIVTLTVSVGFLLPILVNTENIRISAVFLLISIIVATDPLAVVAMLESFGAPHRLRILIEGESLLNDGLALTVYRILVDVLKLEMLNQKVDWIRQGFGVFMCMVVSPILAMAAAWIVAWMVSNIRENKKRQALIVVAVYAIFVLCEVIDGSPALGLVFFGVQLNYYREKMSPETFQTALDLWGTLGYWANNIIFLFAGFMVGSELFGTQTQYMSTGSGKSIASEDLFTVLEGFLLSPIPLFSRIIACFMAFRIFGFFKKRNIPPKTDFVILSYAGLRGALGLILAMELKKELKVPDSSKILILTCSTTCACLLFQGLTFVSVAKKEGTTKRSIYVKNTCAKLGRFLNHRIKENIKAMQSDKSQYLLGTNWHVVEEVMTHTLHKHTREMEIEQKQDRLTKASPSMDPIVPGREADIKREEERQERYEAKTAFYGILLARVHDSWARGALSGSTAHVIVALLEHGIDEGSIVAGDIEDHLWIIEQNIFQRLMSSVAEKLYRSIRGVTFLNSFAEIGQAPLFDTNSRKRTNYVTSRPMEKWWIFFTYVYAIYNCCVAYAVFDHVSPTDKEIIKNDVLGFKKHMSNWIYLMGLFLNLVYVMETMSFCNSWKQRWEDRHYNFASAVPLEEKQPPSAFAELAPAVFFCCLVVLDFVLTSYFLYACPLDNLMRDGTCHVIMVVDFAMISLVSVYRIVRMTPILVVVYREYCNLSKLSRDRVRLAVFHYLHHLMVETRISRELFSDQAYKAVKKEVRSFNRLVEGLMRLELKINAEEMEVVPVIKTRQAVRMMSYNLDNTLAQLKTEGFMPADAEERWADIVNELKLTGEAILWVPQLGTIDWLQNLKWIGQLNDRRKAVVIRFLAEAIEAAKPYKFAPGEVINTFGSTMWYIKKGICKMTEWMVNQENRHHEVYLTQGEFIGDRNILLYKSTNGKNPQMWPHRRYETTTYCEMAWLSADVIDKLLDLEPTLYGHVATLVQTERIVSELKHIPQFVDVTVESFTLAFQMKGKNISRLETVNIPEGKIAMLGCWTELVKISSLTSINKVMHIVGPAKIVIRPADTRAFGMVYIERVRFDDNQTGSMENSAISLVYDPEKKRVIEKDSSNKGKKEV